MTSTIRKKVVAIARAPAIERTCVPDSLFGPFMLRAFGPCLTRAEEVMGAWADRLCGNVQGRTWNFCQLSNGGFYLALCRAATHLPSLPLDLVRLRVESIGFNALMSADAAGIVISLFALNHLNWDGLDHLTGPYFRLLEFAAVHEEQHLILQTIE